MLRALPRVAAFGFAFAGIGSFAWILSGCSGAWEVEHRVEISASPETVWALLTDLESYPEWNPYSRRVEGTLEVGEVVRVEVRHRGVRDAFVQMACHLDASEKLVGFAGNGPNICR